MQNTVTQGLRRVCSAELTVIAQDKEFTKPQITEKYSPKNSQFVVSPKSKISQKENFNLHKMTSQELKKSVEQNPFMRAKLKCLITTTKKSLTKQNELHSPKFVPKPKLQEVSNMFNARVLEKERRQKQRTKLENFQRFMKENENDSHHNVEENNKQNN